MESAAISERLRQVITEEIRAQGPVTFDRFMEFCLYHPEYGYYASGRACRGREGDYYTSPTVHHVFGALIAKQLVQMWRILGGEKFEVVEMGGGEGYLCLDVLDYVQRYEAEFYNLLFYHMVEMSPVVIERQKELLSDHSGKVIWDAVEHVGEMKIYGCFLSNELVDAFPVHRVVQEGRRLKEVFVDSVQGGLGEVHGDPSTPELEQYFLRLGITLTEGQRAEVNLGALRWLQGVAKGLERGFVVTIDYGYPAQELYSPLRGKGTFLCYRGHQALTDPYGDLGLQDMTAHVDFTSLIEWGKEYGLQLTGLLPQYRFLLALGILDEVARMGEGKEEWEGMAERLTVKNLILPGGMGETFKVLIQHKGIQAPQLDGLRGNIQGGEQWSTKQSFGL
ncbi:MAG: SAM-dependent methyltransferase [Deltaproteobacteria bacterium]|nr:SAM-dependent methyltransferase [Deltaproteobacteria bacterium]